MNKLPPRNIHLPSEQQGLFQKFYVNRVDRSDRPGFKHHGCRYFVLDETHDPFARPALQAYAMACQATHPKLAEELFAQWGVPASFKKKCCGTPENCPVAYSECPFLGNPPAPAPHNPADWKALADDVDPVHLGMDGKKWAEAFCQRNKASDFGTMLGWFANAICAGFDEGQRRATAARSVPDGDSIAMAVARGWASPENAHKQMDEQLAWAIVGEVQDVLVKGQPVANTGRALFEAHTLLQEVSALSSADGVAHGYGTSSPSFDKLEVRIDAWLKEHSLPTCQACKGGGIQADGPCACQQQKPPIPAGVYYSTVTDNFYTDGIRRVGKGDFFWKEWWHRRSEFPAAPSNSCKEQAQ